MTYEGSDFTIGTSERDSLIDTTGEVCNAILKWKEFKSVKYNATEEKNFPDSCWMIPTSGHSAISRAASLRQSYSH